MRIPKKQIKEIKNLGRNALFRNIGCCLLFFVLLVSGQALMGETVRIDETKYFQIDTGDLWEKLSHKNITEFSKQIYQQTGMEVKYLIGYVSTSKNRTKTNGVNLPCILISNNEKGKYSQKEIDEIMSNSDGGIQKWLDEFKSSFKNDLPPMQIKAISYEKDRNIMWTESVSDNPQIGKIHNITAMMVTETGMLNFFLHVVSSEREVQLKEFNNFLNRVELSPSLVYQPELLKSSGWERVLGKAAGTIFIVLFIGLLVGTYKVILKVISKIKGPSKKGNSDLP